MNHIHKILKLSENNSLRNSLPAVAGMTDNKDLSKNHASDKPSRIMAFFMPKFCPTSQVGHYDSIAQTLFTGLNRHILGQPQFEDIPSYGGVTLQNIKALWQICRAVACVTESEPRQPYFLGLVLTQNHTQGGHNHA